MSINSNLMRYISTSNYSQLERCRQRLPFKAIIFVDMLSYLACPVFFLTFFLVFFFGLVMEWVHCNPIACAMKLFK